MKYGTPSWTPASHTGTRCGWRSRAASLIPAEAVDVVLGRDVTVAEDLERDVPVEGRVERLVDGARAAAADLREDFIG